MRRVPPQPCATVSQRSHPRDAWEALRGADANTGVGGQPDPPSYCKTAKGLEKFWFFCAGRSKGQIPGKIVGKSLIFLMLLCSFFEFLKSFLFCGQFSKHQKNVQTYSKLGGKQFFVLPVYSAVFSLFFSEAKDTPPTSRPTHHLDLLDPHRHLNTKKPILPCPSFTGCLVWGRRQKKGYLRSCGWEGQPLPPVRLVPHG